MIKESIKKSFSISIVLIVICGFIYPLSMTGISQLLFNKAANGSIVSFQGKAVGSALLGQNFTDSKFFQGRVSSINYNTYTKEDLVPDKDGKTTYSGVASGSTNLAPSNPLLTERIEKDMKKFLEAHPALKKEDIPTDLLTNSGSGLDPHITPQSAEAQMDTVAKASGISRAELEKFVAEHTEKRQLGIFGESRVNVLQVNLEIANLLKEKGSL